MKAKTIFYALALMSFFSSLSCSNKTSEYYTAADFTKVPKIDVHFHYDTPDFRYLQFADSLNFKLVSPNVDAGMPLDEQLQITASIKEKFPDKFAFFGTFPIENFNKSEFVEETIARIDQCMKAGASGIKIWKNIGMVLKDRSGNFVMVDDPAFDPVFNYLQEKNIPLLAHLGEPRNCWLPLEKMTLGNDFRYYKEHPQYHMYLHPDAPSYEDQMNARDNLLHQHPQLDFTGAHLASLEWNVDELARRFELFPNLKVDFADRIGHLQYQSLADRDRVRNFLIKYQDRTMYATDVTLRKSNTNYSLETAKLRQLWLEHWIYLATDSTIKIKDLDQKQVKGLQLPREVIDKIYYNNAARFFTVNMSQL